MKKIGLVGGTGPESTAMYYKELNSRIDKATFGGEMPEIAIESVNFRKAWDLVSSEKYDELSEYLRSKVKNLAQGGADVIALTAATMHVVFDEVKRSTLTRVVSLPKAVCEEVVRKGYKKVALLGTALTMEGSFMKRDLVREGIDVFIPDKEDRELVAKRIYEELEVGIVRRSTLDEFNAILLKMWKKHRIQAVILGCTELPLLLNEKNCVLPCLDCADIHINKIIEIVMKEHY